MLIAAFLLFLNIIILANAQEISNSSIQILTISPDTFKIGDVQLNIKVQNNDNITKSNLVALVSGKGYSTYDITGIDSLAPGEKDYIFVNGNFKESGNITLTIKIDNNIFYENISVLIQSQADIEEQARLEKEKQDALANLSSELSDLKQKYSQLETDYYNKKDNNYDVSKVSLEQLKNYIRAIESDILNEDIKNARANLNLANDEYLNQKNKLDSSEKISLIARLKENAVIFSAIAGALLTFFALSELLKRNGQHIVGRIHQTKKKDKK